MFISAVKFILTRRSVDLPLEPRVVVLGTAVSEVVVSPVSASDCFLNPINQPSADENKMYPSVAKRRRFNSGAFDPRAHGVRVLDAKYLNILHITAGFLQKGRPSFPVSADCRTGSCDREMPARTSTPPAGAPSPAL